MNHHPVLRILSRLLLILGGAELIPVVCCLAYGEVDDAGVFVLTALVTFGTGLVFAWLGRGDGELYRREGILIVVGAWVLASAFGALPYLLTGTFTDPVDALFEAASGFTTTGASVMTDIESNGRGVLFWRSFTQWLGGMGIIVLFVALLPEIVPGARFLFKLEVPGPTSETLHPRVRDTAIVMWKIYLLFTLVQSSLLISAGLDLYDALTHTFSTMSTGGFSPLDGSAAELSTFAQVVIIVFMLLAGVNFSLYYALRLGHRGVVTRDPELRLYVAIVAVAIAVVFVDLQVAGMGETLGTTLVDSAFQVISLMTTTGFATADFDRWPLVSKAVLIGLMFVGGCAGSTSGSMKVARMMMGIKYALLEVRSIFAPNLVQGVFLGGRPVPFGVVRTVSGFFILFMTTWGVGTMVLTVGGHDLVTSASASIAILGNVGPGLAGVGPTQNFAAFPDWQKLFFVFLMWVGRLEVYAVYAVLSIRFWRV